MRIAIDNVPKDLKLRFKSYVVGIDTTMANAIMQLIEWELEEKRLAKQQLDKP